MIGLNCVSGARLSSPVSAASLEACQTEIRHDKNRQIAVPYSIGPFSISNPNWYCSRNPKMISASVKNGVALMGPKSIWSAEESQNIPFFTYSGLSLTRYRKRKSNTRQAKCGMTNKHGFPTTVPVFIQPMPVTDASANLPVFLIQPLCYLSTSAILITTTASGQIG